MPGRRKVGQDLMAKETRVAQVSNGYRATTPEALEYLTGLIHDVWFDLADVVRTPERREVTIPLVHGAEKRGRFGWRSTVMGTRSAGVLVVRNVREIEVDDQARVGDYEVDRVVVIENHDARVLQLHATIPLRFDFYVDDIDVEFVPPRN
jgi:hypothetical protein